jgi:hypothetical protein
MIRNEETQEILFDIDGDDWPTAYAALMETPTGQLYVDKYYDGDKDGKEARKILRAVVTLFTLDNYHASVAQLETALKTLIKSGSIRPVVEEEEEILEAPAAPVVDTTPRGRDGKPLTGSQLKWSEFRKFSESATMSEINLRKRSDPEFANFVRKNMEREFAAEPVGDAVTPAGHVAQAQGNATAELTDFVRKYNREPVANLRPKGGFVSLDGVLIAWADYQNLINRAAIAGLLL